MSYGYKKKNRNRQKLKKNSELARKQCPGQLNFKLFTENTELFLIRFLFQVVTEPAILVILCKENINLKNGQVCKNHE